LHNLSAFYGQNECIREMIVFQSCAGGNVVTCGGHVAERSTQHFTLRHSANDMERVVIWLRCLRVPWT